MLSWRAEYTSTSIVILVLLHIFCCPKALFLDMLCPKKKWVGLINVNWSRLSTYNKNCLDDFLKQFLFWLTVFDQFFHNKCSQMMALGQETSTSPRPSIAIIGWGSLEVHFSTCKDCHRELLVKSLTMSISNASNQEFQFCSNHLHFSSCKNCRQELFVKS